LKCSTRASIILGPVQKLKTVWHVLENIILLKAWSRAFVLMEGEHATVLEREFCNASEGILGFIGKRWLIEHARQHFRWNRDSRSRIQMVKPLGKLISGHIRLRQICHNNALDDSVTA